MTKRSKLFAAIFMIVLIGATSTAGMAQEPVKPAQRPARPDQKAADQPAVPVETEEQEETESTREALRRAIIKLSDQIGLLTAEVQKLGKETERNSAAMQLLLYEERLARVEEKIEAAENQKLQLEAQEQNFQNRLRNIQQELIFRGVIRRSEAEKAIRAELEDAIASTRSQMETAQQRIIELQSQAEWLRQQIEALRRKLTPAPEKNPDQMN